MEAEIKRFVNAVVTLKKRDGGPHVMMYDSPGLSWSDKLKCGWPKMSDVKFQNEVLDLLELEGFAQAYFAPPCPLDDDWVFVASGSVDPMMATNKRPRFNLRVYV